MSKPVNKNYLTGKEIRAITTTEAPEVFVNPTNPAQKLLRNGQVYILQDGKTYTITGQKL